MKSNELLADFCKEVSQNRSALLFKDFDSSWGFLGLNPSILEDEGINECRAWYRNVFEFEFLNEILKRNTNNEVFLHNETKLNDDDLLYALENIALKNSKSWNNSSPYLSTKFIHNNESMRLTLLHPQITEGSRPRAFIRRLRSKAIALENYQFPDLLNKFVKSKKNILISGSTGSGKTTLAQSLLATCEESEHLVILEDTHELNLQGKNLTHLLSDETNSLVDYCSYALRISPDRLVLGELRGEEVLPLVLAMNTGHNGFLTTIHANNASSTLTRLRTLLEFFAPKNSSCFKMVCQNIDIVIHMEDKKIIEIIEVKGFDGENPLFEYLVKSS